MDSNQTSQLIDQVLADINSMPDFFESIKVKFQDLLKELEVKFHRVVLDNSSVVLQMTSKKEFMKFMAALLDKLCPFDKFFPGVGNLVELVDDRIFYIILDKFVDKILSKYQGASWYEQLQQLIAINQIENMDKNV